MKTLKTYGVYGMVEKSIILHHRGVDLKVTFKGGSANTNGIIPARFTTDNPVYQYIIEHSKLFELKNIKLVRSVTVKEESDNKNAVQNGKKDSQGTVGTPAQQAPAAKEEAKEAGEENNQGDEAGGGPVTLHEVKEAEDGVKEVYVTDIQSDARQYLINECGMKAREVRTKAQIEQAAATLGVRFVVKEK